MNLHLKHQNHSAFAWILDVNQYKVQSDKYKNRGKQKIKQINIHRVCLFLIFANAIFTLFNFVL